MKYLITGTAGFIGFSLAKNLLEDDHEIVGIDNINNYYDVNLKKARLNILKKYKNFDNNIINLEDEKKLDEVFKNNNFSQVINLAAQAGVSYSFHNPQAYISSNIEGFVNILEKCKNYDIDHLTYASSSSVYGANEKLPFSTSDSVDHPISLYAASKRANELIAHSYSHIYNLKTTGLRFFTVYGPWGRPDMAIFIFTKKILAGETITLFNNGNHARDFTYIDDIVEGIKKTIDRKNFSKTSKKILSVNSSRAPWDIFNLGNNNPTELTDIIKILEKKIGIKAKVKLGPLQKGDVPKTFADIETEKKLISFNPKVEIDEGISNFVDWFRGFYSI